MQKYKKHIISFLSTFIGLVVIRIVFNHYNPNVALMDGPYRAYIDALVGAIVITYFTARYQKSKKEKSIQES